MSQTTCFKAVHIYVSITVIFVTENSGASILKKRRMVEKERKGNDKCKEEFEKEKREAIEGKEE